jgi:hypothetical protein
MATLGSAVDLVTHPVMPQQIRVGPPICVRVSAIPQLRIFCKSAER